MDTHRKQNWKYFRPVIGSLLLAFASSLLGGVAKCQSLSNSASSALALFAGFDTVTQGNWQMKYGADGYSMAGVSQNIPSYASFAVENQLNYTWASSTSSVRALATGVGPGRSARTWYNRPSFSFDVNLTDGGTHQIALYALDWDCQGRSETVQVVDAASNAVLDTRSISSFTNGVYVAWTISGHVKISVTLGSGPNAVIGGVFFGGDISTASVIPPSITTQPASQTVSVGQSATFSVADTGTAPLAYQWRKNGAAISGAISSSYTTSPAVAADSGSQFTVVLSNSAGSTSSNAAILTVKPATLLLNASSTNLSFGNVNVSNSSTESVTLTNAGNANVTISSVVVSGAGFDAAGVPTGSVLAPGQTVTLNATFAPAAAGSVTGAVTVSSNASNGPQKIALSGTGVAPVQHSVDLSWTASASTVVGYNVYFSNVSGGPYVKLTAMPVATTSYTDTGVPSGETRYYVVTAVNSSNAESAFSSQVSAIVP